MDWKLERQRREKKLVKEGAAAAQGVNIFGEMEREFAQIFGDIKKRPAFTPKATKTKVSVPKQG